MSSKTFKSALAAALASGLLAGTVQAYEAGDWVVGVVSTAYFQNPII